MIGHSEASRQDLQGHIKHTAETVKEHAGDHKQYQDTLIQENNHLKSLIQAMEQKLAKASQDYTTELKSQSDSRTLLDKDNVTAQGVLKDDFLKKYQLIVTEKQVQIDAHNAALKQKIDELAARDTRYLADLQKRDQDYISTVRQLEERHAAQLKEHQEVSLKQRT